MKFINKDIAEESQNTSTNNSTGTSTPTNTGGTELEFNRKNRENYETLMTKSSTQLDGYWDKNNPAVKIILLVLGVVIVFGVIFYVMAYLGSR